MNCEICGKPINNYWGYFTDFCPTLPQTRDRSKDQILYGIQVGKDEFHFYCSEKHQIQGKKLLDDYLG